LKKKKPRENLRALIAPRAGITNLHPESFRDNSRMLCPFKKRKALMAFRALYQLRKLKAIRTCFMTSKDFKPYKYILNSMILSRKPHL
jgi:hypothetical protein